MKLELYYAPFSCALVPYILLEEAGAAFEVRLVNMMRRENLLPEFLAINPKHRVPVLLRDGVPLTETLAMELWIARNWPDARLLPDDEIAAIELLAWCGTTIHPSLTPNVLPQRFCDLPGSEESVRRCAHKLLHENFAIAEKRLAGREWFFDHFTCPDVHFFWCFRRAMSFDVDVSGYPSCAAHFERVRARPATQKLIAFEAQVLEGVKKRLAQ